MIEEWLAEAIKRPPDASKIPLDDLLHAGSASCDEDAIVNLLIKPTDAQVARAIERVEELLDEPSIGEQMRQREALCRGRGGRLLVTVRTILRGMSQLESRSWPDIAKRAGYTNGDQHLRDYSRKLQAAGLIEADTEGRYARFRLTVRGAEVLAEPD